MNLGPLVLEHKELIHNRLKQLSLPFADLSFGNIYLWRKERESELIEWDGVLVVKTLSRDKKKVLIPLSPIPEHLPAFEKILEENSDFLLFPVPDEWCDLFPSNRFEKETKQLWNDYIYQTKKIAEYSGRALDGKRNHVKHFIHDYSYEVFPFEEKFKQPAHELLEKWVLNHPNGDFEPCREAIENFSQIGLSGIVVLTDEKVIGFTLGEYLNQNMYDVQFAKADISFHGIYSFLYQKMAQTISSEWLNFEFDLGIPGLRKNKLDYAPDHFAVKWRVQRK